MAMGPTNNWEEEKKRKYLKRVNDSPRKLLSNADPVKAGIAARLRQERLKKNWTMGEAALEMGIREGLYKQIEAGRCSISIPTLRAAKRVFETTYDFLLDGKREK